MKEPAFFSTYSKENLNHISFPLGGIGAGMFCLRGTGMLGSFSLRNAPNVHYNPNVFAALTIKRPSGNVARVLEGQVPRTMIFNAATNESRDTGGNGNHFRNYGLPRFKDAEFSSRFPFATVKLADDKIPLDASVTGWSPFTPPDPDDSSYPLAYLEYSFNNNTTEPQDAVFYFNSFNFMRTVDHVQLNTTHDDGAYVARYKTGFLLCRPPIEDTPDAQGYFAAMIDEENVGVDTAFFRGGWFDPLTMLWNKIERGESGDNEYTDGSDIPSPGASLSLPFTLMPGETKTIRVQCAWYVPYSTLRTGVVFDAEKEKETYKPWYAGKFSSIEDIIDFSMVNVDCLFTESKTFSDAFYSMDLPPEVIEAAGSNLSIIKSPTVLRQTDGRMWAWEGCLDLSGVCTGSCTHVWNYAQAFCHLFPSLERTLRETEFHENQNEEGHQFFRASLPIRPCGHDFHAAADGQLGGIIKLYRDYQISGDKTFLQRLFPYAKKSIDYCIESWDPTHNGVLIEPQHNTYDIEFWGANGMLTSFYLGALTAMIKICEVLGESSDTYSSLLHKGQIYMDEQLFNGEYFYQKVQWEGLRAKMNEDGGAAMADFASADAVALAKIEGPKYQYGKGCLSDGVLGFWLAELAGITGLISKDKIKSHLLSVHKYNLKHDLREHSNPQRSGYALGDEGGLLLCTWPHGEMPSLPFVYSNEVWTGIEYQVASHLILMGEVDAGLEIVQTCRSRYDGYKRNPFDEYECGHWYARALASYALIESLTGIRYDAATKTLYVKPQLPEFTSFLATDSGYALCHWDGQNIKIEQVKGKIDVNDIVIVISK